MNIQGTILLQKREEELIVLCTSECLQLTPTHIIPFLLTPYATGPPLIPTYNRS